MQKDSVVSKDTVVSALFWKSLERVFSQGLNLAVQIVLARILIPDDFGRVAIISAIINYAFIFVQAGLGTALIQKNELENKDVDTLFTGSIVIAAFFYCLLFVFSPFVADYYQMPDLIWPMRILSLTLFLGAINSIQTALFSRQMRFKALFFRTLLAVPISGAVGIVMALKGFGIWSLIAHSLVNLLVIVVYMSFDRQIKIRLGFSKKNAYKLYSFSGMILLSGLVSGFSDTCRTMVIGKRYSTSDLAYYDKGYSYSSLVSQIVGITISSVMLPAFSRTQDNFSALLSMVRKSVRMSAFIMFPVLLCLCAAAKPFILLLLTEKWAMAIPFFMLFCIFRIPGLIATIDKQMYYALGNSSISLFYEIGLLAAQVMMLIITVPISISAIAIGAFIVEVLGNCSLFTISSLKYGYTWKNRLLDIIKPLTNGTLAAALVYLVSFFSFSNIVTLLIQIPVGAISYYLLSRITKDDNLTELRMMLSEKLSSIFNK